MVKTFCTFSRNAARNLSNVRTSIFVLVFLAGINTIFAANIILSPLNISTKVGKTFTVDVLVSGNKDPINAVSSLVSFPADVLSVSSISKAGSFINLWAEEPFFSNSNGTASFEGVTLNPGFSGATGKVVTITFKAKQAGNVNILVKSGSVLANDGNATNVLGTTAGAFVVIDEAVATPTPVVEAIVKPTNGSLPVITSSTHPDSTKWYSSRDISFEWAVPSNVSAVRTLYSSKETSIPSKVYDPPVTNRSFTTDEDGIMYMHVQFKNGSTWGDVAHYKFQIDTGAPESLSASFPDGVVTTNQTPSVLILAEDKLSGLSHIIMSIDSGEETKYQIEPSNIYHLPKQASGKHSVKISSVDMAGNISTVTLEYTIQAIAVPIITEYTKNVDFENQLKVSGTTYPQAVVEVLLIDRNGDSTSETVVSNETGVFRLTWSKKIDTGVYEIRARAIDAKGAVSDFTNSKIVVVDHVALVRLGIFVMNWLSVILILILVSITIVGTFWYSLVQFSRFRRKVRRTITEVESTLKTNVAALKRDTEEFHTLLVKAEKKRELTKEEQTILKKFKKRLEITEKEIDKKLDQIG
ncbi:hypothetical protein K9M47_00655 [Candidatus Gracilibacteria bacterium]|nr:hypothetical protein [Candidatus Gracilibacteria bacterium]MCF7898360.1 hypothetical protein [Candidatus Paceibacterota bacterium]